MPRNPPLTRSYPWWKARIASSATARSPSKPGTCGSRGPRSTVPGAGRSLRRGAARRGRLPPPPSPSGARRGGDSTGAVRSPTPSSAQSSARATGGSSQMDGAVGDASGWSPPRASEVRNRVSSSQSSDGRATPGSPHSAGWRGSLGAGWLQSWGMGRGSSHDRRGAAGAVLRRAGRRRRAVPGGRGSTRGPPGCPAGDLLPPRPRRDRGHAVAGRAVLDSGAAGRGRGGRGLLPWSRRRVRGGMDGGDPRDLGVVRLTRRVGATAWRPIRQALCVPVAGLGGAAVTSGRPLVPAELVDRADLAAVSVSLGSVGPPSRRRRSSRAQCLSSNNIPAGASGPKLAATTYYGGRATLPAPPARGDITAGSVTTASSLGMWSATT